ncbi:MAG: hypothetical protein GY778_09180, partial [bacterium]|nr:hypothetical protein [bacterium]
MRPILHGMLATMIVVGGCAQLPEFPDHRVTPATRRLAFDMNGDGRNDYWQDLDATGRKTGLLFDDDGDGRPDEVVPIADPPADHVPHIVIILDGVPFEIVEAMMGRGRFRLFPPPSRLISVFPVMTDLALAQAFEAGPCLGYEALYYDVARNRLSDGNHVYLSGRNAPWTPSVDYRCDTGWDVRTYLDPAAVWRHEMAAFARTVDRTTTGTIYLYTVATAGLGTRGGADAIVEYLETTDALCERLTYERRGRIRFTLLADHGHGMTPCRRISLKPALRDAGMRVGNTLRDDCDVVAPTYGLVTCAVLHTRSPKRAAEAILDHSAVELVMYRAGEWVSDPTVDGAEVAQPRIVVRNQQDEAEIQHRDDHYTYRPIRGDPLALGPIFDRLAAEGKLDPDGSAADRDLFEATATHAYPDALHRIWSAFETGNLVDNPADVLVSLKEGYACGRKFFSALIEVRSTHGNRNRR